MTDSRDRKRRQDWDERERLQDRAADRAWARRGVPAEIERIRSQKDSPGGLREAKEELGRLDRIRERDPLRRASGFDARKARDLEDMEIRTNPEAFLRRRGGEGLDPATERAIRRSLAARDRARR